MRTEKAIRRELSNYEFIRDDAIAHNESTMLDDAAIRALRFVLEEPEMVECPNCHSQEELFSMGMMQSADCDCGYRYATEIGWTAPLKERINNE